LAQNRVASLVVLADTAKRLGITMMIWLVRGNGRTILVDAGFKPRGDLMSRWRPLEYQSPDSAVANLV
jgi:hypothetical protein